MAEKRTASLAGSRKRLAVFVHGFGSSAECWTDLLSGLRTDPRVDTACDLECYSYPTRWFNLRFCQRIPRLQEVSAGLAQFLEAARFQDYTDITLVGHSQGGLVIQSYLAEKLRAGRGEDLSRIAQVILVATPNLGSTLLSPVRNVLFRVFENPQEQALRVLNPEIRDIQSVITERVCNADKRDRFSWPIPVRCFWGDQDRIVPEASARGPFAEGAPLPGDHFSILKPQTREHFEAVAAALLEPVGHKNFFEVDLYETVIQVNPLPEDYEEEVRFGTESPKKRVIRCDNRAELLRSATFSRHNRCDDLFEIRYRTRNDGFIRPAISHPNEAPAPEIGRYNDYGTAFSFQFTPQPGETYKQLLEIYQGFDAGHRDVHLHLGRQTRYRRYRLRLDLSAYCAAGYQPALPPKLYFFPRDMGTCDLCKNRKLEAPVPCTRVDPAGIWEWELRDIREGVIDAAWDVVKVPAPVAQLV